MSEHGPIFEKYQAAVQRAWHNLTGSNLKIIHPKLAWVLDSWLTGLIQIMLVYVGVRPYALMLGNYEPGPERFDTIASWIASAKELGLDIFRDEQGLWVRNNTHPDARRLAHAPLGTKLGYYKHFEDNEYPFPHLVLNIRMAEYGNNSCILSQSIPTSEKLSNHLKKYIKMMNSRLAIAEDRLGVHFEMTIDKDFKQ